MRLAANRIEERAAKRIRILEVERDDLKAKLEKAMQTLSLISTYQSYRLPSPQDIARTTLAELKGQDDE